MDESENSFAIRLKTKFWNDLQGIACKLCESHGLRYNSHVESHIDRWISFVIRLVEPKERFADFSKGFWNRVPKECIEDVHCLADKFEYGQDVNPYQSATIKTNNISKKIGARTDLLWADWGIHHFHLTKSENLDENGFCKRSDFLLFAIVRNDCVYFLDVKRHPAKGLVEECFSNPIFVRQYVESWPELAEFDRLNGVSPGETLDTRQIALYRKIGLNVPTSYDGSVYMMGMGLSAAGIPTENIIYHDMLIFEIESFSAALADYLERKKHDVRPESFSLVMDDCGLHLLCHEDNLSCNLKSRRLEQVNRFFNQSWLFKTLISLKC